MIATAGTSDTRAGAKRPESVGEYAEYYWNGIKSVAADFWNGLSQRSDEAFSNPSFYSISNYLTMGLLDTVNGSYQAAKSRTDAMLQTPNLQTISNWVTSGTVEMAQAAVTIDSSNPGKQWKASLGIASLGFGVYSSAGGCSILKPSGLGQSINPNRPTYGYDK